MVLAASRFSRHDLGMLLVALIWGGNFSASKYALHQIPPLVFSSIRFLFASVLLLGVTRLLEPDAGSRLPRSALLPLAALGVVGNTGYQAAFMAGLAQTTAINASLIVAGMPVLVGLLGTLLGIEVPSPRLWLGIVVGTAGVVLVIAARGVRLTGGSLRGDLLVLLAVICWALFTLGVRKVGAGLSPLRVTALTTVAGTPGLLLAAWPQLGTVPWREVTFAVWIALAYSALLAIVVAYVLWSHAVQAIGGSRTTLYNCVIPLVAILGAWVLLGERPAPVQGLGAALVIGGVLVSRQPVPRE